MSKKAVVLIALIVLVIFIVISVGGFFLLWNTAPSFRTAIRKAAAVENTYPDLSLAENEFIQSGLLGVSYADFLFNEETGEYPLLTRNALEQFGQNISTRDKITPDILSIEVGQEIILLPKEIQLSPAESGAAAEENPTATATEPANSAAEIEDDYYIISTAEFSQAYLQAIVMAQGGDPAVVKLPAGVKPEDPTDIPSFAKMAHSAVTFNNK